MTDSTCMVIVIIVWINSVDILKSLYIYIDVTVMSVLNLFSNI